MSGNIFRRRSVRVGSNKKQRLLYAEHGKLMSRSSGGGSVQAFDQIIINPGGTLSFGASSTVQGLLLANTGYQGSITVPSGTSLTVASGGNIVLNGQNITTTGTVTVGNFTSAGTIQLAGATIQGQPSWAFAQSFPGLACGGVGNFNGGIAVATGQDTHLFTGSTVTGQPTWNSSQTFPGITNTSTLANTGLITASGGITVPSGQTTTLTTGSTISGQPSWTYAQSFPGLACGGVGNFNGGIGIATGTTTTFYGTAAVTGQPTWNNSQTFPGITTTTLTATGTTRLNGTILPSYAPLPSLTSTVDFYGDSFVQGALPVPAGSKWSSLLAAHFSITENNQGVGGTEICDTARLMNVNRPLSSTNTCFIMAGWNDIVNHAPVQYDSIFRCLKAAILQACLPNKADLRLNTSPFTWTGTWSNITSVPIGMTTTTTGDHCDGTFTGRYICWCMQIESSASAANCPNVTFAVDGTTIITAQPLYNVYGNGATPRASLTWIYDATTTGSHTLKVTFDSITGTWTTGIFVLWATAFNFNPAGATPVYVNSVAYQTTYTAGSTGDVNYNTFKENQRNTVLKLRNDYGLPVYFIDTGLMEEYGQKGADMVHPNVNGHLYIYNRVLTFLSNGEYPV